MAAQTNKCKHNWSLAFTGKSIHEPPVGHYNCDQCGEWKKEKLDKLPTSERTKGKMGNN